MPKNKKSTTSSRKYVPYVKGFRPPTLRQQSEVLGSIWKATPAEYDNGQDFFESIPRCTSIDDWLAQYNEEGQTYHEFLFQTPWLSRRKLPYMKQAFNSGGTNLPEKYPDGKIYILPLGDFDSDSSPQFDALIEYATKLFFCLPVSKLPGVKLNHTEHDTFWVLEDGSNTTGSARKLRLSSRFDAKSGRRQLFSLLRYDPNLTFSQEFWHKMKYSKKYTEQVLKQRNNSASQV